MACLSVILSGQKFPLYINFDHIRDLRFGMHTQRGLDLSNVTKVNDGDHDFCIKLSILDFVAAGCIRISQTHLVSFSILLD